MYFLLMVFFYIKTMLHLQKRKQQNHLRKVIQNSNQLIHFILLIYLEKCLIVKGKGKNFVGDIIYIHKDFVPTLKKIDDIAKQCNIKLSIKGSYEQIPDPTKTFKFSTANVGKRLKFIIMDKTGKKLVCNNVCLASKFEYNFKEK